MPYAHRDVPLYYVDQGSGAETVLFCHGAGGNSTSWWQQVPEFARRYRCLAFDHRGFGRSVCSPEAFSVAEFGADALAVLDAAGVDRAHFVCQSMGGWTGVQVALNQPQRIASLVLSDTLGGIALPAGLESARTIGRRMAQTGAVSAALAPRYPEEDPKGAFLYLELSAFNTAFDQLDLFGKLFAEDVLVPLARASDLTLPLLVVSGLHDLIWPPEVLRELASHLPGSQRVEIDAGHSPYFENAGAFNEAVDTFLGKSSRPG